MKEESSSPWSPGVREWQDASQVFFDFESVLIGGHRDMKTDQRLQFAERQAEGVGLRGIVPPEVVTVRTGSVDKSPSRRAAPASAATARGFSRRQQSGSPAPEN